MAVETLRRRWRVEYSCGLVPFPEIHFYEYAQTA
jgi:hypothetical protein